MKKFLIIAFCVCFVAFSCFGIYRLAMDKLYPVKYKAYIMEFSDKYDLDPALVASVINVESRYKKDARSSKGAIGLMQLMPDTAIEVASKANYGEFKVEYLYHERSNIMLGCCYLRMLLDMFGNNLDLALLSYNAGPYNVSSWLKNKQYSDDGITLLSIPFAETKDYLNKVYKNYKIYKSKY